MRSKISTATGTNRNRNRKRNRNSQPQHHTKLFQYLTATPTATLTATPTAFANRNTIKTFPLYHALNFYQKGTQLLRNSHNVVLMSSRLVPDYHEKAGG